MKRQKRWLSCGLATCLLVATLVTASPAEAGTQIDDDNFLTVLSIGDSFIAGTGAGFYYSGQGPGQPDAAGADQYPGSGANCYQSRLSYPEQYVQMLNDGGYPAALYQAACHGAHVDDLDEQFATIPDGLKERADIILISAGGNDVGFGALVGLCLKGAPDWVPGVGEDGISTCDTALARAEGAGGTDDNGVPFDGTRSFDRTMADLRAAVATIASPTSGVPADTRIVLVGYPNLNSPECGTARGQDRILSIQSQHDVELQRIVRDLSTSHGARFDSIHPTERFRGAGPCHSGLSGPDDPEPLMHHIDVPSDGESFHPNQAGHLQYADLIFDNQIHTKLETTWEAGQPREDVVIRSKANGQYVSAELDYPVEDEAMLRAGDASVEAWKEFTIVGDCKSEVGCAIQSKANGLYVAAELGYEGFAWGELRARESSPSAWEMFGTEGDCESAPGCSLRSKANGRYVSVELDYTGRGHAMLRARATAPSAWEMFYIGPPNTASGSDTDPSGGSSGPTAPEYLCARGGPNVHCKDGVSGAWVWTIADFADEVELDGDLLCIRGARAIYCKQGALDTSWTLVYNGADDVEVSGDRVCVRDGTNLHCKDGGIQGTWVWNVADWADEVELSGDLLCARGGRNLHCKDGALTASWTLLTRGADDVEVSGGRICVRNGTRLHCKDGGIFGGWVWNVATWADEVELSGNLLCARGGRGSHCKQGSLSQPWVKISGYSDDVEVSGDRICVRNGTRLHCKDGGIYAPWVWNVADWADEVDLG